MSTKIVGFSTRLGLVLKKVSKGIKSDLARKIGVNHTVIGAALSGKTYPNSKTLVGIATIGVSVDWLLTGEGRMWREGGEVGEAVTAGEAGEMLEGVRAHLADARAERDRLVAEHDRLGAEHAAERDRLWGVIEGKEAEIQRLKAGFSAAGSVRRGAPSTD